MRQPPSTASSEFRKSLSKELSPFPVRAELVEALYFPSGPALEEGQPLILQISFASDGLRANGF